MGDENTSEKQLTEKIKKIIGKNYENKILAFWHKTPNRELIRIA